MKTRLLLKVALVAMFISPPTELAPGAGLVRGQAPAWVIGDQAIHFPNTPGDLFSSHALPIPNDPMYPVSLQYNGGIATRSQFIQLDDLGQPLFFIIDGFLYDREGYLIAAGTVDGSCDECLLEGTSEIIAHAVPGRCGLWYIFQSRTHSIYMLNSLEFSVLDLRKPNPLFPSDPGRRGVLLDDNIIDNEGFDVLQDWPPNNVRFDLNANNEVPNDPYGKSGVIHMDAVTVEAEGRSFLCATNSWDLAVYEMTSSNIIHRGTHPLTVASGLDQLTRMVKGELEAVAVGSQIRVGLTQWYKYSHPFPSTDIDVHLHIHALELDGAATAVPVMFQNDNPLQWFPYGPLPVNVEGELVNWPAIAGIEFSPNGNYLYWNKSMPNTGVGGDNTWHMGYLDWAAQTFTSFPSIGLLPFVDSELELNASPDGSGTALYLSGADALGNKMLGALIDPDNPGSATWVPNAFSLPSTTLCDEWTLNWNSATDRYYLLMPQSFADPADESLSSEACCEVVHSMTAEAGHTAASGAQTWTPSANPFGNIPLVRFADDLVIPTGSQVTAHDLTFVFAQGTGLVIEPGASLNAINCTFEGACGGRWIGIEVRGNTDEGQEGLPHPAHQGYFKLVNSTVENAEVGALLGERDGATFPKDGHGGIIWSSNSTFRNCREGVKFLFYQNHVPLSIALLPNRSRFSKTTFTVDEDYPAPYDFKHHVYMHRVDGIPFSQCTFENLVSDAFAGNESAKLGHGIYSLDADYRITPGCWPPPLLGTTCPEDDVLPSTFHGLDHGIHAEDAKTTRAFQADHCRFENNICGVYTSAVVGAKVTKNDFIMGSRTVSLTHPSEENWLGAHRGIYSFDSYAFAVDDNELSMSAGATSLAEGIVIGYSRDHNDYVFRNSAEGLENAYVGEGICADLTPNYTPVVGIQFLCNENEANHTNIWSRKVTTAPLPEQENHTIRSNQGQQNDPADDRFDQGFGGSMWDLQVTTTHSQITYWHQNSGDFVPTYFTSGLIPQAITIAPPAGNCESKFVTGPPIPNGLLEVRALLLSEKLAYGNTRYLFDQLIDGGSTDEVVLEIMGSWPQDAWELRDYLLAKSPYLSVEALKEMVVKDIMPDAMVTEICVANPDATRSEGFLPWLQKESDHPLPQYMIDQIMASWDMTTYRTTLESDMGLHHAEMTQAGNLLMEMLRSDTTNENVDSLRMAWSLIRTPAARYAEALTLVQMGEYGLAGEIVQDIPEEHEMGEAALAERQRMLDLIAFFEVIANDERTEAELTAAEQDALETIVDGAYDRPAWWAQNLLCFLYDRCRAPLSGGEPEFRSQSFSDGNGTAFEPPMLLVHPNPASTWAAFDHRLKSAPESAMLVIRDVGGREMARVALSSEEGQTIWDSRQVEPGVYTVELLNAGELLQAEKLVIKQ